MWLHSNTCNLSLEQITLIPSVNSISEYLNSENQERMFDLQVLPVIVLSRFPYLTLKYVKLNDAPFHPPS